MRGLLHINFRAILAVALVGFAEDGVQRLYENVVINVPAEVCTHDQLHTFYWVICSRCSFIHIDRQCSCEASHGHKHSPRRHTSNWKANARQIEVTGEYFTPSDLTEQNRD